MDDGAIYVGVDGGATGSRAVAVDRTGEEVGRAAGPPALVTAVDVESAASAVAELVGRVLAGATGAGGSPPVARLVAALAGAGRPAQRDPTRARLEALGLAGSVSVCSDGSAAFHDAFGVGPGILLVGGTGSVALGRSPDGRDARAGGWGTLLGDEGSGWWLGIRGLRAVGRAADGRGPPTALTARLPARLGLSTVDELIGWAAGATKRDVAALAPTVLELADAGDDVAEGLARDAAAELAAAADAVRRALEPWPEPPAVAVVGGLIAEGGLLRRRLEAALSSLPLRFDPRTVVPARGAARMALAGLVS